MKKIYEKGFEQYFDSNNIDSKKPVKPHVSFSPPHIQNLKKNDSNELKVNIKNIPESPFQIMKYSYKKGK